MDRTVIIAGIILLCCAAAGAVMLMGTGTQEGSAVLPAVTATSAAPTVNTTATQAGCTSVTITQTDGTSTTFPCRPERLIVANANAAEMVIALGAGDRIVGVTDSTLSVPYIMDKIPNATSIGNWQTPNVEQILALHPDAVIAYSSYKPKNLDQLVAANITVISLDCYRLATLPADARAIGALTGRENAAEVYARMVEDTVAEVDTRVKTIPRQDYPSVYFESYTDYTAAASGSGSNEMLVAAGGRNIAGDTMTSSMKVSPEWVVSQQPQYIMKVVSSSDTRALSDIVTSLKNRTGWNTIPAVQNNRVYAFANDLQYGPRAYIGLVYTARLLHPDTFRDLHPKAMRDEYAAKYVSGTNESVVVYP
ncbi:MAG: ABC transporter substrate-binding protein [Methanoregula sp.]|jgi:iron complex transport system substrate-binding protein|nr:ABC transporter substrate-binding protein [Methanoregula sp.]